MVSALFRASELFGSKYDERKSILNKRSTTAKERRCLYDYLRNRRLRYQALAFAALGDACSKCGSIKSLRLRFNDPCNPLKKKHQSNLVTLYRLLVRHPSLRGQVSLRCDICRLERGTVQHG